MPDNLDQIKEEVFSRTPVKEEMESWGFKFSGTLSASGWQGCHDPYREDEHPSASVYLGDGPHKGTLMRRGAGINTAISFWDLVRDFHPSLSGADFGEILRHYADLAGVKIKGSSKDTTKELIATYDYTLADGTLHFQACRYNPKDFRQRRPDGSGGHIWNLTGIEIIPYNLPNVVDAERIYITEGEKDADAVNALGDIVATCGPMGAKKWWDSLLPYYRDKDIVILEDNDIDGQAHTQVLLKNLFDHVKSIRIIRLPGLPQKGDVYDWLVDGKHTRDELLKIVNATKVETEYNDPVLKLNEQHAVIMVGGKCFIMNEITDPVFERPDINFSSPFDFRTRYSNRKVPNIKTGQGQPKEVSLADAWLDDIDRRQYDGIVFDPEFKSPDTYYNLFRGFLLEPKSGDWSLYMDHMIEVICGGNESHGMWLMTWMARILQEPGGKRPGTCVVLRGEQGTGKGCFVSLFGRIFGTHFLQITNQKHLTSNFNQHLKDAILVFVDEGFWAGDKTAEGVLKGLITEDHHLIEQKGKDVIAVKNHINLVMASNSEWVIPAAMEERRFAVFDVSNKHRRDKKYFNSVFNQMLNKGGCEAMLHDLLNLDLKTYREQYDIGEIPRTAALMDQIVHSMNSAQKFWFERLRDGTLLPSNDNWIGEIQTVVLHHSYMAFANDIGVARNKGAEYQFLKELRRVCPDMERIRMPNVEGSRPWGYRFPSLEECRQAFCDKLSININFNENIEVDDGINEEEV